MPEDTADPTRRHRPSDLRGVAGGVQRRAVALPDSRAKLNVVGAHTAVHLPQGERDIRAREVQSAVRFRIRPSTGGPQLVRTDAGSGYGVLAADVSWRTSNLVNENEFTAILLLNLAGRTDALCQFVQSAFLGWLLDLRAGCPLAQRCQFGFSRLQFLRARRLPQWDERAQLRRECRLLLLPRFLGTASCLFCLLTCRCCQHRVSGDGLGESVGFLPPLARLRLLRRIGNGRVVKDENPRRDFDGLKFRVWIEGPRRTPLEVLGRVIRARQGRLFELGVTRAGERQRDDCCADSVGGFGFCFHRVRFDLLWVFDSPATLRANHYWLGMFSC